MTPPTGFARLDSDKGYHVFNGRCRTAWPTEDDFVSSPRGGQDSGEAVQENR